MRGILSGESDGPQGSAEGRDPRGRQDRIVFDHGRGIRRVQRIHGLGRGAGREAEGRRQGGPHRVVRSHSDRPQVHGCEGEAQGDPDKTGCRIRRPEHTHEGVERQLPQPRDARRPGPSDDGRLFGQEPGRQPQQHGRDTSEMRSGPHLQRERCRQRLRDQVRRQRHPFGDSRQQD